ncbi:MAG: carboxypeptidase-like regulatory domain-containing protein [Bacteroidetes Order II. Incertae sedis bacterium]|nr:carboxypeptidase-like regulatory domain-containing protein [Bacteroidetes Order II. bacterium]
MMFDHNARLHIILFLSFFLVGISYAQQFSGRVIDAETRKPLNAASVLIEGQFSGLKTDENGRFSIIVNRVPFALVVRYVGYESAKLIFTRLPSQPVIVQLRAVSVPLEVEISGEDPAIGIMRNVIARKNQFYESWKTYHAEMYARFSLWAGQELVQIKESNADVYGYGGTEFKEWVRAYRNIPQTEESFRFADREPMINFYNDLVLVQGRYLPGPTHPRALTLYNFRLGKKTTTNQGEQAEIFFTPAQSEVATFSGNLIVDLNDFVLTEIYARPYQLATDGVVKDYEATYRQKFETWLLDVQVPVTLDIEGRVLMGKTGVRYPLVRFKQQNKLFNIRLNEPIPDSLMQQAGVSFTEPGAERRIPLLRRIQDVLPYDAEQYAFASRADTRLPLSSQIKADGFLAPYLGESVVNKPMNAGERILETVSKVLPFLGLGGLHAAMPNLRWKPKDVFTELEQVRGLGVRVWADQFPVLKEHAFDTSRYWRLKSNLMLEERFPQSPRAIAENATIQNSFDTTKDRCLVAHVLEQGFKDPFWKKSGNVSSLGLSLQYNAASPFPGKWPSSNDRKPVYQVQRSSYLQWLLTDKCLY